METPKYHPDDIETADLDLALSTINKIKDLVRDNKIDDMDYYEATAELADVLREEFTEAELIQVQSFHALSGSGMSEGIEDLEPISEAKKQRIDDLITSFLQDKFKESV